MKRSTIIDADGILLGAIAAPANRHDSPLLDKILDAVEALGSLPERMSSVHLWTAATTRRPLARS